MMIGMARVMPCRLVLAAALLLGAAPAGATTYFVDSLGGSDSFSGTAASAPWRSVAPVNAATLAPGDVVSFRRGGVYPGRLVVRQSGTAGSPVTVTAYETGAAPVLENPGGGQWESVVTLQASYLVVEQLLLRTTPQAAVSIATGADHNVVRDCEMTDVGFGVEVSGAFSLVTRNFIHDLNMVNNTPGGDDDYGAVAVSLYASDNEVSYNHFVRCRAPSYDYGNDGGAVEFYGTVNRCSVHHNYAEDTEGFAEVGGTSGDQVYDNVVAYNVALNTGGFGWYHISGTFAVDLKRFRIENNTIILPQAGGSVFGFGAAPAADTMSIRNNLVVMGPGAVITNQPGFTHDHNLFWRLDGATDLGLPLDGTDQIADPLLVDRAGGDYHLQAASPAVDQGADLGYALDFEDHGVPFGAAPDIGAYEYSLASGADGGVSDGGTATDGGGAADAGAPDAAPAGDGGAPADGGGTADGSPAFGDAASDGSGPPAEGALSGSCGCALPRGHGLGGLEPIGGLLLVLLGRRARRR
jgi:hypothetical protein